MLCGICGNGKTLRLHRQLSVDFSTTPAYSCDPHILSVYRSDPSEVRELLKVALLDSQPLGSQPPDKSFWEGHGFSRAA